MQEVGERSQHQVEAECDLGLEEAAGPEVAAGIGLGVHGLAPPVRSSDGHTFGLRRTDAIRQRLRTRLIPPPHFGPTTNRLTADGLDCFLSAERPPRQPGQSRAAHTDGQTRVVRQDGSLRQPLLRPRCTVGPNPDEMTSHRA